MTDAPTNKDFTEKVKAKGTTTGEVVGEALESAVESAGEKVESAVEAVGEVVEESVETVFPVDDKLDEMTDPYGDALKAQESGKENVENKGIVNNKKLDNVLNGAQQEMQGEVNEFESLIDELTPLDTREEVSVSTKQELPQLQDHTFSSQIFWLAATFILLYLLMARSVLPRIHEVLEKRRHRIEHDLDQAERLAKEADESKADYELMHAESVARSQAMIADAETSIREASDEQHDKLDAELAERMSEADATIAKAAAEVKNKLKPAAEAVAQEIVKAITGSDTSNKKVAELVAKAKW